MGGLVSSPLAIPCIFNLVSKNFLGTAGAMQDNVAILAEGSVAVLSGSSVHFPFPSGNKNRRSLEI